MNQEHLFHLPFAFIPSILLIQIVSAISLSDAAGNSDGDDGDSDLLTHTSTSTLIVAAVFSSLAFLVVLVAVVVKCADCYNSEVSSENHPACSGSDYKWGGAEGYTSASVGSGAGFRSGEAVEMTPQQSLPYAMIPTNVPSSAGFQGYNAIGTSGQAGDGRQSAGVTGGHQGTPARSNSGYGGGSRHYNPAAPQEPPPAYDEARYGHR